MSSFLSPTAPASNIRTGSGVGVGVLVGVGVGVDVASGVGVSVGARVTVFFPAGRDFPASGRVSFVHAASSKAHSNNNRKFLRFMIVIPR